MEVFAKSKTGLDHSTIFYSTLDLTCKSVGCSIALNVTEIYFYFNDQSRGRENNHKHTEDQLCEVF